MTAASVLNKMRKSRSKENGIGVMTKRNALKKISESNLRKVVSVEKIVEKSRAANESIRLPGSPSYRLARV
ncbi:hypothetical protein J6590_041106 [Homalodisca vitripennis]|nr:hypothetical protein J6590_046972 [Homalodisca vitripennis]KAG8298931.1 hypothetical protein J6590_002898 [Homalodisca vitripennis]KAG8326425.1 hypothetical protein J6590_041106 [Homalodisca vitripennis]